MHTIRVAMVASAIRDGVRCAAFPRWKHDRTPYAMRLSPAQRKKSWVWSYHFADRNYGSALVDVELCSGIPTDEGDPAELELCEKAQRAGAEGGPMTTKEGTVAFNLNKFHIANIARQHEAFAPPHSLTALVVCVQEEVGELAAAVLGVTGEKKRKAHLTNSDVLDAVADAMTYLSLVAGAAGCRDLEGLLRDTFNMVSDRAGSAIKV